LRLSHPSMHLAGQHYIIRLTAPDGYTASRSYSVASAPDGSPEIEITVERLPDGEVSSFLHDEVVAGDELEVRGPIGGWFVWQGHLPALLIGGGSGVVPLMAMLRLARSTGASDLIRLVVSVRDPASLYYASELPGPETTIIYTRQGNPLDGRAPGHLTPGDLPIIADDATAFICGSSAFADAATDLAIGRGIPTDRIRVERFGPTG
jgi:ferredoxin-NADP reductase